MTQPSLLTALESRPKPISKLAQLAAFFKDRPGQWIDGRDLEFAGRYAWRSRTAELRTQLGMTIENRQRHLKNAFGDPFTVSEYRYIP